MIKSIVAVSPSTSTLFPALYRNIELDFIVLFTSATDGTVLFSNDPNTHVGWHTTRWVSCLQEKTWQRLRNNVPVSIENT